MKKFYVTNWLCLASLLMSCYTPTSHLTSNENSMRLPKDTLDLSDYQWKNRLILIFSPNQQNFDYQEQAQALNRQTQGIKERDLIVFHFFSEQKGFYENQIIEAPTAARIREKYEIPADEFRILLIGKDGGVKLRERAFTSTDHIFGLIDRMPMRQREMREQNR